MLYAIHLHKIILQKSANSTAPIIIQELKTEMNVSQEHFDRAIKILEDLSLIKRNLDKGTLTLTLTGQLANIDKGATHWEHNDRSNLELR